MSDMNNSQKAVQALVIQLHEAGEPIEDITDAFSFAGAIAAASLKLPRRNVEGLVGILASVMNNEIPSHYPSLDDKPLTEN